MSRKRLETLRRLKARARRLRRAHSFHLRLARRRLRRRRTGTKPQAPK